ncbi:putative non-specific serine/threonine protein kinase [Helianthus anomalus]
MSLLDELNLRDNRLEGQIPPNICKCKSLTYLGVSKNNLTGAIPVELFRLSALSSGLDLSQNHLVGPIPQEIGKLESLTDLDLSQNDLVSSLNLSFHNFYGEVHMKGIFKNASAIELDANSRLCGGIPEPRFTLLQWFFL